MNCTENDKMWSFDNYVDLAHFTLIPDAITSFGICKQFDVFQHYCT